jgi:hypothetical protein
MLIPSRVEAQILVGHVIAEDTREPVAQAEIRIVGANGDPFTVTSDSAGRFQVRVSAPGSITVRITHIAYVPFQSGSIPIERGETVEMEIRLGLTVIPLDPLVVTARRADLRLAGYYDRLEWNAFGRFFTREQLDQFPFARVTDLFRTLAGVQVVPIGSGTRSLDTMRGATGRCLPAVYFDGVRIEQSADFPIDDLLVPDFLEGVEVYSSIAGAPIEYADANCGVILLWSRSGREGRPFTWKRVFAAVATVGLILFISR